MSFFTAPIDPEWALTSPASSTLEDFSQKNFLFTSKLNFCLTLDGNSLSLSVCVYRDISLLFVELCGHSANFILNRSQLAGKAFSYIKSILVFAKSGSGLCFKKFKLFRRIGQTNQTSCLLDNYEPSPISHGKELSEVSLGNLDKFTLVSPLLINPGTDSFENFSLEESEPFDHKPIASLLKTCKSTSSEEDQCVAEPIPLPVKCSLVVARACNFCCCQACISQLGVWIHHAVWEAAHADPDTFQHSISSQLVHDQWGLNISGLLVVVRYKATDEVRFAAVEGSHQLSE